MPIGYTCMAVDFLPFETTRFLSATAALILILKTGFCKMNGMICYKHDKIGNNRKHTEISNAKS